MVRPMFFEWAVLLSIPLTDTFFLSRVSNDAAAAVGMVMPLMLGCFVVIEALCIGGAAVAGQRIGANDYRMGNLTFGSLFVLVGIALIFLVAPLVVFAPNLVDLMDLPTVVADFAITYLSISAFMLAGWGLCIVYKAVLNTYGHPGWNLCSAIVMTVFNVIFNYVVVFGKFGVPPLGVKGVAAASVLSAMLSLVFLYLVVKYKARIHIPYWESVRRIVDIAPAISRIGVPSAIEPLSFQFSALVMNVMIATLGAQIIAARVYTHNTYSLCLLISISFSIATQTIIAQLVGKRDYDSAYLQLYQSLKFAVMLVGVLGGIFLAAREPIMEFFSRNSAVVQISLSIFLIYFVTEFPRTINMIASGSLRATGDAWFISACSLSVTWFIAVPLAYFLGIEMGYGLTGILFAILADEVIRASINMWRWRQRKWQRFGVIAEA